MHRLTTGAELAVRFLERLHDPRERERIAALLRPPGSVVHIAKPLEQVMIRFAEKAAREETEVKS